MLKAHCHQLFNVFPFLADDLNGNSVRVLKSCPHLPTVDSRELSRVECPVVIL